MYDRCGSGYIHGQNGLKMMMDERMNDLSLLHKINTDFAASAHTLTMRGSAQKIDLYELSCARKSHPSYCTKVPYLICTTIVPHSIHK